MRLTRNLLLLTLALTAVTAAAYASRKETVTVPKESDDEPMAPELDGAVAWLNTDHPIRMSELRGRVVILDFWTYGCINCMHVIPVLRQLEEKRAGQPLEVIGVHSAKFANEKAADHVRAAVERYGITHPVAVDSDMAIWDHFGVQAWPTLIVIRPDGRVAGSIPGEVTLAALDSVVGKIMAEAKANKTLAAGPALPHRPPPVETGELSYPGKIIAASDGRLFISDSRHHRVLVTAPDGRILDVAGTGKQGRKDGSFEAAELDDPQGLALDGDTLYVADARGYAVLALDLAKRTVRTLAGTGKLGEGPLGSATKAIAFAVRSPWDVLLHGRQLFVAMAGSHQIGVIDLDKGTIAAFAGNGREAIVDGAADAASFAQPSGLSLGGETLYVADSESSGVRAISLKTRETTTLLGTGLFDWGDQDGPVGPKMIQHPLAVAASPGGLWIADTYNSKLKRLSPGDTTLATVLTEAAGKPLLEPGGLWVDKDGSLLIADTGNGRILRLPQGATEATVVAVGRREAAPEAKGVATASGPNEKPAIRLAKVELPPGKSTLPLALTAPPGFAFSDGAPWSIELRGTNVALTSERFSGEATAGTRIGLHVDADVLAGDGELDASVHANICDAVNHAACYPVRARYAIALKGSAAASTESEIVFPLNAPR